MKLTEKDRRALRSVLRKLEREEERQALKSVKRKLEKYLGM